MEQVLQINVATSVSATCFVGGIRSVYIATASVAHGQEQRSLLVMYFEHVIGMFSCCKPA